MRAFSIFPIFFHILAALCWSFALAALSLDLLMRLDPFSTVLLHALDVPGRVGNAVALHGQVMAFLLTGSPLPAGFGAAEARHLADVATLLSNVRWAGLAALGLAMALGMRRVRPVQVASPDHPNRPGRCMIRDLRLGALLLPALLLGLGLAALEWPLFFTAFHPLLFPGGGYSFNPHVHLLVRLYPKEYFAWMGASLAAVTALLALAALLVTRLSASLSRPGRAGGPGRPGESSRAGESGGSNGPGRWRPDRTCALALLVGLLLAIPAYFAGQRSLTPLAPCFLAYYLLSGVLLAGSVLLWATRAKALGLSVLLAALLVYGGLDLGLRVTQAQAMETMRHGDALVAAIQAHARRTGNYPACLEQLVPAQVQALSTVLVKGSAWQYTRRNDHFFLGFVGPLGFHFQYASHQGRWKWLDL